MIEFIKIIIINAKLYPLSKSRKQKLWELSTYNTYFDLTFPQSIEEEEEKFKKLSSIEKTTFLKNLKFENKLINDKHTNQGCLTFVYIYFKNILPDDVKDKYAAQVILDSFRDNMKALSVINTQVLHYKEIIDIENQLVSICERSILGTDVQSKPMKHRTHKL